MGPRVSWILKVSVLCWMNKIDCSSFYDEGQVILRRDEEVMQMKAGAWGMSGITSWHAERRNLGKSSWSHVQC